MTGAELLVCTLGLIMIVGPLLARGRRSRAEEDVAEDYEPTVTVITPMFNEGDGIRQTIESILGQDYPAEKLDVIVVDDCSTDDSYEHAVEATRGFPRASVLKNEVNLGKRKSINRAVRESSSEIIISVDSDVIIEPDAVRHLVRRFTTPDIAAVGGRVDIRNKRKNWLTRMQAVKYYYGYHFLKNLERAYRSVLCLSGCLTAYRREVLLELEPLLERRNILGISIKYGEDRFLTRQIVKAGYKTTMTMDAVCRTNAPDNLNDYFAQQLRWRRSNIVDYFGGLSHVWRVHPLVALHFYSVFGLFLAYPALIYRSLVTGGFWPLMLAHVAIFAAFGVAYRVHVRRLPKSQRVAALDLLPMAIVMPVTYAVLTPLALFTLDSGKWETRGHEASDEDEMDVPTIEVPQPVRYAPPRPAAISARKATLSEDVRAA